MNGRNNRLLVRLLLATAVAAMIVHRYTSPRSLFRSQPYAHTGGDTSR